MDWHIVTSEYPPQAGGVSDYTKLIATGLAAAGDEVHVWCPASAEPAQGEAEHVGDNRLYVHRDFGDFAPADLRRVGRKLDQFPAPRRLLVQWVPQGYGYRSINLPFCWWLWRRAKFKHDRVEVMIHEPFLAYGEGSPKQDLAAAAHRLMVSVLLRSASQVWVSIPDWETQLRPYADENKTFGWLPVPSTIPVIDDPDGIAEVRARYAADGEYLVGHFGAYDQYMTELMLKLVPSLLNGPHKLSVMLLGKGSLELRDQLLKLQPQASKSIHASGVLSPDDISRHVSACDVMLQPYQDGVSGRRTSVMTALSHGVSIVTNAGKATEGCWRESQAVRLTQVGDIRGLVEAVCSLLTDQGKREQLGSSGAELYRQQFDVQRSISALRGHYSRERAESL